MADKPYRSKKNEVKKTKYTKKKDIKLDEPVKQNSGDIQVHFGNYKKIEIMLLNAINKNIIALLSEFREVLKEIRQDKKSSE